MRRGSRITIHDGILHMSGQVANSDKIENADGTVTLKVDRKANCVGG